jgi:membrane peptidoglycan carboxypeptidase
MRRLLYAAIVMVLVLVGCFGGLLIYAQHKSSQVTLTSLDAGGSSVVLAGDGKTVLGHFASAEGKPLKDADISRLLKQAHMAAEDRSFYTHGAISLSGMAFALARDAIGMSVTAGGSTIDQQVAKRYVGTERTLQRKIDELPYAYRLEQEYTKEQILGIYMNGNYYGRGSYGVADASQTWFGVSAKSLDNSSDPLDVARAAFLAALIQQPSTFAEYKGKPSNLTNADAIWNRTRYVLNGLRDLKGIPAEQMVSQQTVDAAKALLPLKLTNTVKDSGNKVDGDPYLMNYVKAWMVAWQTEVAKSENPKISNDDAVKTGQSVADGMLARGGLRIRTYIDGTVQQLTVSAHKRYVGSGPSGFVMIDVRNGGVLAMSGGRDYSADPNNYAMYAARPPGSTMKAFVLADAVNKGASVNSVFAAPASIRIDGPPIYDHTRRAAPGCKMTLANALAASNNVVYVEAATGKMASCNSTKLHDIDNYDVTPQSVADLLRQAGADASPVPGRDSPAKMSVEPRLAIGATIDLSPLKLGTMGATLDGGVYHKPHLVDSIDTTTGKNLFTYDDESHRVLDEKPVAIVDQTMTGVFTHGTAVGDQVDGHPLAGKTGTTDEDQGDSWIIAFNANNPKYKNEPAGACAGWAGKNNNLQGADLGKVCQNVFRHWLDGRRTVPFPAADLNSGNLVGLKDQAPPPTIQPETTPPTTPSTTTAPTTEATTESQEPTRTHRPRPSYSSTRTVPPPQQTGVATGNAPPPGNPQPPGQ